MFILFLFISSQMPSYYIEWFSSCSFFDSDACLHSTNTSFGDNCSDNSSRPTSPLTYKQSNWDKLIFGRRASAMLCLASVMLDDDTARMRKAHLQAVRASHERGFLNSSLGIHLDPHPLPVGTALCPAAPIYPKYHCICGWLRSGWPVWWSCSKL